MNLPINNPESRTVDLSEDEFNDIYCLLKTCISAEMGLESHREVDGAEFVKSCTRILESGRPNHSRTRQDLERGFVPLLERLYNAKSSPVMTNDGVFYRVIF